MADHVNASLIFRDISRLSASEPKYTRYLRVPLKIHFTSAVVKQVGNNPIRFSVFVIIRGFFPARTFKVVGREKKNVKINCSKKILPPAGDFDFLD